MNPAPMRYHSVRLDKSRCTGCTHCLMHCPTEAIRVRGGRAHILDNKCIDCGECIRVCEYHAKTAVTDDLQMIRGFRYTVALPDPSLYGQFRDLQDPAYVLHALKQLGFTDVFEVSRGADVAARVLQQKLRDPAVPRPLISSACPAVVRLIQERFPDLLQHVADVRPPMEAAAMMARVETQRKYGCCPEEIGIFYITPCPARMTAIRNPLGQKESCVDGAISIMEVFGALRPLVSQRKKDAESEARATSDGLAWAMSNGEADSVCPGNSLAADGIQNCIHVLQAIENDQLRDLDYFEGSACVGGCVGGPLTFENNFVAKNTIRKLRDLQRVRENDRQETEKSVLDSACLYNDAPIRPNPVLQLDDDLERAMRKLERMNRIIADLPGYNCGSCGSPTCRSFAEDIVQGYFGEMDCIHKLRDQLKVMAQQMVDLAQTNPRMREQREK